MAKIVIGGEVNIPVGKAEEGVKSLKAQLRELKVELQGMDETDPKFRKIAQAAGEVEDKIKSVNEQVAAFAGPAAERNLAGIIGVTQGIAGGFAAAQGAAALFSGENEQLQKSMLKVQAAMALVMGLQEIQNTLKKESAAMTFLMATAEKVYAAAVGQSTGAMKKFRLALIATGIGALVALVGLLIANWKKVKEAVLDLIPGLGSLASFFGNIIEKITDFVGLTSEADRQLKALTTTTAMANANLERTIQVLEATGGKEKEVLEIKKQVIANELALIEARAFAQEEDAARYQDLVTQRQVLDLQESNRLAKLEEDRLNKNKEAARKREEERKKEEEKIKAEQDRINAIILQAQRELELGTLDGQAKDLRALEMAYEDKLKAVEGNEQATRLLMSRYEQERREILDQYATEARAKRDELYDENLAKKKAEDDKLLAEQKAYEDNLRDLKVNATLGIVSAIGEINNAFAGKSEQAARKAFNIQKALSMAETIVSTYSAAQRAYASQLAIATPDAPIRAAVAAGIAIAGGLARLAAISKTKFESKTAEAPTTAGGDSAPQPQSSATNLAPDITRTRLGGGDSGEVNTRVFVVESDITNTQERVRRIDRRATVE